MKNKDFKVFLKDIIYGTLWFTLSFFVALGIKNAVSYSLADILFIEGILLALIGTLSGTSGDPIGLGIQSLELKHPDDVEEINYEITPEERGNMSATLKKDLLFSTTTAPLIIGGILAVLINFII